MKTQRILATLAAALLLATSSPAGADLIDAWEEIEEHELPNVGIDSDGDAIFDADEIEIGTNPFQVDSDNDTFSDYFESVRGEFGFDPTRRDMDADQDGLTDRFEREQATSPGSVDTDGDRYSDFDETLTGFFGFDPRVPSFDNDYDGVEDSLELEIGTSPNKVDSDGDGITDFEELQAGLDPTVPDDPNGPSRKIAGRTYSDNLVSALDTVRKGGNFPSRRAAELPYPRTFEPLLIGAISTEKFDKLDNSRLMPTAALVQLSVANPLVNEPVDGLTARGPGSTLYPSYNQVVQTLRNTAMSHSSIARLFVYGRRTIEEGGTGRRLYALKVSDNVGANEDEPEILFMGEHHARELITSPILLDLIKKFTDGYPGDKLIKKKVDNLELWFFPIVNPDGYHKALGELGGGAAVTWRKNVRKAHATQTPPTYGVDLNRNYAHEHITSLTAAERAGLIPRAKSSNGLTPAGAFDPLNNTYAGTPFSEVETQSVRDLANNGFRSGNEVDGFKCSISWHSAAGEALHPMAHNAPPPAGGYVLTAEEKRSLGALTAVFAKETGYADIKDTFPTLHYPVFGDSEDWLFRGKGVLALTIEAYSAAERGGAGPWFFPETAAKRDAVATNNVNGGVAVADSCLPDWGDADDPFSGTPGKYPSLKKSDGANHLDFYLEWLGADVDGEDDAQVPNMDEFDDGVVFSGPVQAGTPVDIDVTVSVLDRDFQQPDGSFRYTSGDPKKRLYLNAWADWNGDGMWSAGEKIIGAGAGKKVIDPRSDSEFGGGNQGTYRFNITPPDPIADAFYFRFRLDYGEDVGEIDKLLPNLNQEKGTAAFGEVEDYPTEALEVDHYEHTEAQLSVSYFGETLGPQLVTLHGPTTVHVDLGNIADTDGDGLEQVSTIMTQLELSGTHPTLGPMVVRLRSADEHPFMESIGEIEEHTNGTPDTLDIPPFVTSPPGLTAESGFGVYFEIELLDTGVTLHTHESTEMWGDITHKPPKDGDAYWSHYPVDLYSDDELIVGQVEECHHEPDSEPGGATTVTLDGVVDVEGAVTAVVDNTHAVTIEGCLGFTAAQIASELAAAINGTSELTVMGVEADAAGNQLDVNAVVSIDIEAGGITATVVVTEPPVPLARGGRSRD